MAEKKAQTFDNHAKMVPMFHYVAMPILLINLLWSLYRVTQIFTFETVNALAVGFALLLTALFARTFALGAQDRVIRLEERMRMEQLLPDDLKSRVRDFTTKQLIALRFASDTELPDLARKVLEDGTLEQKVIKQQIQSWRADYQRV